MHVSSAEVAPEKRSSNSAEAEDEDLDGVSVLGGKSKGGRELVVKLVDVLVQPLVVQDAVSDVVPCVLHHEEHGKLREDLKSGREGHLPC